MKLKSIGVPMLVFFIYMWLAVLFKQFVEDMVLVTILTDTVTAVAAYIYYRRCVGDSLVAYSRKAFPVMAAIGAGVWFISSLTVTWMSQQSWYGSLGETADIQSPWLYILLTLVVAPISEEIMFRGILLRNMRQLMPMGAAYIVTAVIFGLCHGNVSQFYVGVTCGILFALIYEYTGRLHISMLAHMCYNLFVIVMSGRLVLSDLWFSPAVLISLNMLMFAGLLMAGIWLSQLMRRRVGVQPDRRNVNGQAIAVSQDIYLTAGKLSWFLMPGVTVLVLGPDRSQLYAGPAADMGSVPGLCSRQVEAGSMFSYCQAGDPNCMLVAFSVL